MNKLTKILILGLLIGLAASKVELIKPWDATYLLEGDRWYAPLSDYVNVQKFRYPVIVHGDNGFNQTKTFKTLAVKSQSRDFLGKLNWMRNIKNDTTVLCYDDDHIIIQVFEGEGKGFQYQQTFTAPDANVICQDMYHYPDRNYLYIGCVGQRTATAPGDIYIYTWDFGQNAIVGTQKVPQDDGFEILNRLQFFLVNAASGEGPFLAVYDLGNTTEKEDIRTGKSAFRLFRNVDTGKLKYLKLIAFLQQEFQIVYNFFTYHNSVIVSGRLGGENSAYITLVECKIDLNKTDLECGATKSTFVESGMVGLVGYEDDLYTLDFNAQSVTVARLQLEFTNPAWSSQVLYSANNVEFIQNDEGLAVRGFYGNAQTGVIVYGHPNFYDGGYTLVSFKYLFSFSELEHSAVPLGNSVVTAYSTERGASPVVLIEIKRPIEPFLFVDTRDISCPIPGEKPGYDQTFVEVRDEDTKASGSLGTLITCLGNVFQGGIRINDNINEFVIYGGKTKVLQVGSADILRGNGLTATVSSKDGVVTGQGDSVNALTIAWNPPLNDDEVQDIAFYQDKALVHFKNENVKFYNCQSNDQFGVIMACNEYFTYQEQTKVTAVGYQRFARVGSLVGAWACDTDGCFLLLVTDAGEFHRVDFGVTFSFIKDLYISGNSLNPEFFRVVGSFQGTDNLNNVTLWQGEITKPETVAQFDLIDQSNAGIDQFCPTQVYPDPEDGNQLLVMNNCGPAFDQAILKYQFTEEGVTLSGRDVPAAIGVNPTFCPMGKEHFVYSTSPFTNSTNKNKRLYSFGANDGLSYYSVPANVTGIKDFKVSCLSHMRRLVVYAKEDNSENITVSVIIGNRGQNQLNRYPVFEHGTGGARLAAAFEGRYGVIHWFRYPTQAGGLTNKFFLSKDAPLLLIDAKEVQEAKTENVVITFANALDSIDVKVKALIEPPQNLEETADL